MEIQKKKIELSVTYYGYIVDIWELDYGPDFKVPLFKWGQSVRRRGTCRPTVRNDNSGSEKSWVH